MVNVVDDQRALAAVKAAGKIAALAGRGPAAQIPIASTIAPAGICVADATRTKAGEYYDMLPDCMKARIVLVEPTRPGWLDTALDEAQKIVATPYAPSPEALGIFHQNRAFREMQALIYE